MLLRRVLHAATVEVADSERSPSDLTMWKQISIDMPRTHPTVKLFQDTLVQELHRRLLFLWAVRHPASGYVQGINDLATPFFVVFLAAELGIGIGELCQRTTIGDVPLDVRQRVEADTYWCFSRLLDGIQDHYTFAQPGIQRMVHKLHDVVARVDRPLSQHLASQDCQFIQFSFRWFNCLLMRELRLHHIVRMWDSYLCDDSAECGGFASFHAYVCAAFLCSWSRQLRQLDFQEIMLFLQRLPTDDWTEDNIDVLLSQAFVWFSLFEGSARAMVFHSALFVHKIGQAPRHIWGPLASANAFFDERMRAMMPHSWARRNPDRRCLCVGHWATRQ